MINVGIVGVGFMGYTHYTAYDDVDGARVTAIATRDEQKRRGDWTGIHGNFGPPGGQVDLSDVNAYADYRDLLNDDAVELVDVCLPNDLHESVVVEALEAGKHVLVEKPIAVELDAGERMVEAAQRANRLLMVGHVLPFFPEFRFVHEVVQDGRYGKLRAAHFRRVIAPPSWSQDISDFRRLGGWGIDLHIHDNHFISLICGTPRKVFSRGILQDGLVNHVHTQYLYDDSELAVSAVSGGIAAEQLQFVHGFEVYCERGSLLYDAGTLGGDWSVGRPLTVLTEQLQEPELAGGTEWYAAFRDELQLAINSVRDGQPAPMLSANLALDALRLSYAEARSVKSGEVESL